MTDEEYIEKEIKKLKNNIGDRYLKNDMRGIKQLIAKLDKMENKLKELHR